MNEFNKYPPIFSFPQHGGQIITLNIFHIEMILMNSVIYLFGIDVIALLACSYISLFSLFVSRTIK